RRAARVASAQASAALYDREAPLLTGEAPLPTGPAPAFPPADMYLAAERLSPILFNRASIAPVTLAALLPLALAGATVFPFKEVLQVLRKLVLF
ncbi:MAG: hypothetical protein AAFX00_11775, partial [Pseudomonadota bacterium]